MRTLLVLCCAASLAAAGTKADKPRLIAGVNWYDSLASAKKVAGGRKAPRPILWLRVLGDLAGKT